MAATQAASTTLVCAGTTTIAGPHDIIGIFTKATTSFTITDGTTTFYEGTNGVGYENVEFRTNDSLTVTVVGGGYITLFKRVK